MRSVGFLVVLSFGVFMDLRGQSAPIHRLPKCFSTDSGVIAFGSIGTSEQSGDRSGVQFTFKVIDGQLRGWVRDARGGVPPAVALDTIAYDPTVDSLYFAYYSSAARITRYSYWVKPDCRVLQGRSRLFETADDPGQVYSARVVRSTPITEP